MVVVNVIPLVLLCWISSPCRARALPPNSPSNWECAASFYACLSTFVSSARSLPPPPPPASVVIELNITNLVLVNINLTLTVTVNGNTSVLSSEIISGRSQLITLHMGSQIKFITITFRASANLEVFIRCSGPSIMSCR